VATIPPTAPTFPDPIDPQEILDFAFELHDVLEPGETIDPSEWEIEILIEGVALGLEIMEEVDRAPALEDEDRTIGVWLRIAVEFQDNAAFEGSGIDLPMRATGKTTSDPFRIRQRTAKVKVAHQ